MGFESGVYNEQDKKKKQLEKLKIEEHQKKILKQRIAKEYISAEEKTEEDLHKLHDLVDKGVLSNENVQQILDGKDLDEDVVQEIFDKIDEMEDIKNIDRYLPIELRITKEDYHTAVIDDVFRVQTITKLNTALTVLSSQISPDSVAGINLFSGFLTILDKNLVKIQENTIDMKDNLNKIHDKKFQKHKMSLMEKIVVYLKELFN